MRVGWHWWFSCSPLRPSVSRGEDSGHVGQSSRLVPVAGPPGPRPCRRARCRWCRRLLIESRVSGQTHVCCGGVCSLYARPVRVTPELSVALSCEPEEERPCTRPRCPWERKSEGAALLRRCSRERGVSSLRARLRIGAVAVEGEGARPGAGVWSGASWPLVHTRTRRVPWHLRVC